jgi:hypothetical protein
MIGRRVRRGWPIFDAGARKMVSIVSFQPKTFEFIAEEGRAGTPHRAGAVNRGPAAQDATSATVFHV